MDLCNYSCADQTRYYDIEAIEIPIVYNKYGDYDPNGLLYVLKKDANVSGKALCVIFPGKSPSPMKM